MQKIGTNGDGKSTVATLDWRSRPKKAIESHQPSAIFPPSSSAAVPLVTGPAVPPSPGRMGRCTTGLCFFSRENGDGRGGTMASLATVVTAMEAAPLALACNSQHGVRIILAHRVNQNWFIPGF